MDKNSKLYNSQIAIALIFNITLIKASLQTHVSVLFLLLLFYYFTITLIFLVNAHFTADPDIGHNLNIDGYFLLFKPSYSWILYCYS
jgi:hypothetical protein